MSLSTVGAVTMTEAMALMSTLFATVVEALKMEDERWFCTQCGGDGWGFHACPGLPGENEW